MWQTKWYSVCEKYSSLNLKEMHRSQGTSYYNLFSQIPEYCKVMEESEVVENAFSLMFAFDEIVALGYRENVNLAQIRTFTEMDSHEEKVFRAVRQASVKFNVIKIKLHHKINSEIIIIYSCTVLLKRIVTLTASKNC